MRNRLALLGLIIGLGLAYPAEARDGEKSVADGFGGGKATASKDTSGTDLSKKEYEAYLDGLYDDAVAAAEAFENDPTRTEENYYGTNNTYEAYSSKTQLYSDEESIAIRDKLVRGSYEPKAGDYSGSTDSSKEGKAKASDGYPP